MSDRVQRFSPMERSKIVLEIIATLLVIAVAAALLYRLTIGGQPPAQAVRGRADGPRVLPSAPAPAPLPSDPVSLADAAVKGSANAKVVLIEYSDFQCPFCGKFVRETLPTLDRKYVETGKVLLAFRHVPLQAIHPAAMPAAESAECARRQGKFWKMHDRLFESQQQLLTADFGTFASELGLDVAAFDACVKGPAADTISSDAAAGKALGISGTPTFLVGTLQPDGRVKVVERITGAQSPDGFGRVFDGLLKGN